jgi:hypothetical protein
MLVIVVFLVVFFCGLCLDFLFILGSFVSVKFEFRC